MKANTYVVKPFGISEVKVIALKGDPGTPTQEQINAAVDEYMTEHPEAQIPDGSITEQKLSSDVVDTLNDVDNKADKVGYYPDLIAGTADNLLSSSYQTDRTPYLLRRTPYGARERGNIVGGSIVWNQLCNAASVTVANGHKYFMKKGAAYSVGASTGTAITGLTSDSDMVIDLTLMFGPTIADYIYTQEQAAAGAGVALAKALAGITADYYPYDAGSIKSVTGLTEHRMTDGNGDVIGEYPLDSTLTLRGLPKLDGGSIYYDGDVYKADGTVERRYKELLVDRDRSWVKDSDYNGYNRYYFEDNTIKRYTSYKGLIPNSKGYEVATGYIFDSASNDVAITLYNANIGINAGRNWFYVGLKSSLGINTLDAFKNWLDSNNFSVVLELATPTTEQAEPYTELQICDPAGTEEWVGASMPVGHDTKYYEDLKGKLENIPDVPSTSGTYVLKATVSSSGVTYSWVEE